MNSFAAESLIENPILDIILTDGSNIQITLEGNVLYFIVDNIPIHIKADDQEDAQRLIGIIKGYDMEKLRNEVGLGDLE